MREALEVSSASSHNFQKSYNTLTQKDVLAWFVSVDNFPASLLPRFLSKWMKIVGVLPATDCDRGSEADISVRI